MEAGQAREDHPGGEREHAGQRDVADGELDAASAQGVVVDHRDGVLAAPVDGRRGGEHTIGAVREGEEAGRTAPPISALLVHAWAEVVSGQLGQLVLAETERLDQGKMLLGADELGELLVELVDELGVLVAKAEAAMAFDVLAGDHAEGVGLGETRVASPRLDDVADRETGKRKGVGPAGLDRGGPAALSGTTISWPMGTSAFLRIFAFDCAGHDRERDVGIGCDVVVVVNVLGVAFLIRNAWPMP